MWVTVKGYHKDNFFIVTQAPLPTTMSDMWKMVLEQKVSAIVNLAQPDECEQVLRQESYTAVIAASNICVYSIGLSLAHKRLDK